MGHAMKEGFNPNEIVELVRVYRSLFTKAGFANLSREDHANHLDYLETMGLILDGIIYFPPLIQSIILSDLAFGGVDEEDGIMAGTNQVGNY